MAELVQRSLWGLALAVLLMNLPFGFWRAGEKRFTRPWFVAVHAPVPFVILLRVVSGLGWHLVSFPILIGAFFTGQLLGGAMRRTR
jgi:F0F1-type ATP synthase membrane subunit a